MQNYKGYISFPESLWQKAEQIGRQRTSANKGAQGKGQNRGELSSRVDTLGALAELIAKLFLDQKGIAYTAPKMVDSKPIKGPDLTINGQGYDVKCVREDSPDLLVNHAAHNKDKGGIKYYWFIQLTGKTTARHWVYAKQEISGWKVKSVGYTEAYFKPVGEALPQNHISTPQEADRAPQATPDALNELIDYFERAELPKGPVRINGWTTIVDPKLFVESHLEVVKTTPPSRPRSNFIERLEEFRSLMKK